MSVTVNVFENDRYVIRSIENAPLQEPGARGVREESVIYIDVIVVIDDIGGVLVVPVLADSHSYTFNWFACFIFYSAKCLEISVRRTIHQHRFAGGESKQAQYDCQQMFPGVFDTYFHTVCILFNRH